MPSHCGVGLPHINFTRTQFSPWQEVKSQSIEDHESQTKFPGSAAIGNGQEGRKPWPSSSVV